MNHEGFLRDILDAPARLERVLDAYASERSLLNAVPRRRSVLFTGLGSSRFAALRPAAELRAHGLDGVAELASNRLQAAPRRDLLVVGISASGTTPETVAALERHRGVSATVAVTNAPDSPLAAAADVVLPLHAGVEEGGVSCLTYQATLAVLDLLRGHLLDERPDVDRLRPAVGAATALRAARRDWLEAVVALVEEAGALYLIAPAERHGSALQGALMLREGPRLPADGTEAGDWLHVDVYLSKRPRYTALLFTGSGYEDAILEWCAPRGARVVAVGDPVEGAAVHVPLTADPALRFLIETAVPELVAAELWRRGIAVSDPALV